MIACHPPNATGVDCISLQRSLKCNSSHVGTRQQEGLKRLLMFFPGVKADRREAGVNHSTAAGSFKVSVQQACLINAVSTAVPNYKDISLTDTEKLFCKLHLRPSIHRVKMDPLQFDLIDV